MMETSKNRKPLENPNTLQQDNRISVTRGLLEIMKITGIWQWKRKYANEKEFQKYQRLQYVQRAIIHIPLTFIYVTLHWLEVFLSPNFDHAIDVLFICFTETALIIKIINIWHYSIKACNFFNELGYSPTFKLISPEEVELWQSRQKQFHNIVNLYIGGSFIACICGTANPLYSEEYELPSSYWVPFEWRTNKRNYWIAYVYNVSGIAVTATTNVSIDIVVNYFLFYTALLYQVLGLRLARLKADEEKNLLNELNRIFKFDENIRRITRECETLVSSFALAQIILSALILCFTGYRMLKLNIVENFDEIIAMLQFLFVMILEIYLPCYFANQITWYSSQLCTQIYSSEWLEFSIPIRKLIYLYMEFIKHPVKVKACNYFHIGLQIFTKVINNAYSLFALIVNVNK